MSTTNVENNLSYQTNFTGLKFNNNPLNADINSFSNANNVYLNKYGALISRPPIDNIDYPWEVYGINPIPLYLKLVDIYHLVNNTDIYVIYNTNTGLYNFRYKNSNNEYSNILTITTVNEYAKFKLVKFKTMYILFTSDGARVLDINNSENWVNLSLYVDIPVTLVQTGNTKTTLENNKLTKSHKESYIVKTDSDDTLYYLPENTDAEVSFLEQEEIAYTLTEANEHTRKRLLRELSFPTYTPTDTLVSMVDEKIAIAHSDRVDISLDYGATFTTILYPTLSSLNYKNTAGLSDDGLCFFYVHTDGVYRYDIGLSNWTLIEVSLTSYEAYNINDFDNPIVDTLRGVSITGDMIGANYAHFVNAERFAFSLAYQTTVNNELKWIAVYFTKGLNITNAYTNQLDAENNITRAAVNIENALCSYATKNYSPINVIGDDLDYWSAYPYINHKTVKILSNETVVFHNKKALNIGTNVILKSVAAYVKVITAIPDTPMLTNLYPIDYATVKVTTVSQSSEFIVNDLLINSDNSVKMHIKQPSRGTYWLMESYNLIVEEAEVNYTTTITVTFTSSQSETQWQHGGLTTLISHRLDSLSYLELSKLLIYDTVELNSTIQKTYTLPFNLSVSSVVIVSGTHYIIYDDVNDKWYTNIPLLTTLTIEYIDTDEFTTVPTTYFNDQNLWLGIKNELWIVNNIDNKLLAAPSNTNTFSKTVNNICPISTTSKAIFFEDSITLAEETTLSDGSVIWYYYPLKFSVGVRARDSVVITNDGKLTLFPTKLGLAALTYQLDVASTEQAITYLTDEFKNKWSDFYNDSSHINIIHNNTQLIISNGTNNMLIYDFRTAGWYPLTLPSKCLISKIQTDIDNFELLELLPQDAAITTLTNVYNFSKENDELYSYEKLYLDLNSIRITWNLTSQVLLLEAPNHYKNISQLIIDQVDSSTLEQSAFLTTMLYRQRTNILKPSIELTYDIDTFGKIIRKVNWWKVMAIKWQLENKTTSTYPTQLRLYNVSIRYDVSYEVK